MSASAPKAKIIRCKNPRCKREYTYTQGYTDSREFCYICMLKKVKK